MTEELMGVEYLLKTYLSQKGYITFARQQIWTGKQYSDIDVLGAKPLKGIIHFGECKTYGGAGDVVVIDPSIETNGGFIKYWLNERGSFIQNIERLFNDKYENEWIFDLIHVPKNNVKLIEVTFCGNIWIAPKDRKKCNEAFQDDLRKRLTLTKSIPKSVKVTGSICSTFDLITTIMSDVRKERQDWGKRYGDIFLDIIREFWRFISPESTGWVGVGHSRKEEIAKVSRKELEKVLMEKNK